MSNYPEHDKLAAIKEQSQICGEFLDWLVADKGLSLGVWVEEKGYYPRFAPGRVIVPDLLAEFFGINQTALENEKRAILDEQRSLIEKEQTK